MENGRVMAVKFLDLQKQYLSIKEEVDKAIWGNRKKCFYWREGGGEENDYFIRIIAQKRFLNYGVEVISSFDRGRFGNVVGVS